MRERMYGENGIFTRQGEAAFNSEEELENAIRDTVDEMTERMKLNRDAHLKLARSVFGFSSQALPKARRYAADQRLNWANRQDMASIELNRQEFLHNADERNARLLNLITMQEAYNRYAARNGFSAEQKEFGWKKVRSITYSQLAETFINSGNLNAARKLVDEDGLWMADDRDRIGMRIRARDELLRAREEAEAKSAEQRETRKAVRSAVRDILKDSDGFPSLEEQRDIALGRADACATLPCGKGRAGKSSGNWTGGCCAATPEPCGPCWISAARRGMRVFPRSSGVNGWSGKTCPKMSAPRCATNWNAARSACRMSKT